VLAYACALPANRCGGRCDARAGRPDLRYDCDSRPTGHPLRAARAGRGFHRRAAGSGGTRSRGRARCPHLCGHAPADRGVDLPQQHGKLRLDDPIGAYLPTGTGWGDAAHRAITVRDLLTQTSGLAASELTELATTGTDPNIAQEALAQPLTHSPGMYFEYSQRGPDLLAFVVQQAVKENLQTYAQRKLFDPLGIPRSSYTWLRDRAGNTYGYAHLFLPPAQFAKLGLLMQNDGIWNGRQVVPGDYVRSVGKPTPTNGCYGLLFWTNAGSSCTGGDTPYRQTVHHRMIPAAPADLYDIDGALHQNSFVIPSLNMTITWTGIDGDTNLYGGTNPAASDLYDNFFHTLLHGVRDRPIPDPGPYQTPPAGTAVSPLVDPGLLQRDLAPNPGCTVLTCDHSHS
jgi:hypothetical protein